MAEMNVPKNVSQKVINDVKNIMKTEGNKRKIDTDNEAAKLGELLNGGLSNAEKAYVQGFIEGYQIEKTAKQEEAARKEVKDSITPDLKKELKGIVNKRNLVDIEGAKVLADKLEKADLNDFEKNYIKGILSRSGFENMIPVSEANIEPNPVVEEPKEVPVDENKTAAAGATADELVFPEENHPVKPDKSDSAQPVKKQNSTNKSTVENSDIPLPAKAPIPHPHVIQVTKYSATKGKELGEDFVKYAHRSSIRDTQTSNEKGAALIKDVNKRNAYHFFNEVLKNLDGTKNFNNIQTDRDNKVKFRDLQPAFQALLDQAKDIGLQGSREYNNFLVEFVKAQGEATQLRADNAVPHTDSGDVPYSQMKNLITTAQLLHGVMKNYISTT